MSAYKKLARSWTNSRISRTKESKELAGGAWLCSLALYEKHPSLVADLANDAPVGRAKSDSTMNSPQLRAAMHSIT